jgi:hypothetical protein
MGGKNATANVTLQKTPVLFRGTGFESPTVYRDGFSLIIFLKPVYRLGLDYGLDDHGYIPDRDNGGNFSFRHRCVQTCSGAHTASYPMGTGGNFTGGTAVGA